MVSDARATVFCLICVIVMDGHGKKGLNYAAPSLLLLDVVSNRHRGWEWHSTFKLFSNSKTSQALKVILEDLPQVQNMHLPCKIPVPRCLISNLRKNCTGNVVAKVANFCKKWRTLCVFSISNNRRRPPEGGTPGGDARRRDARCTKIVPSMLMGNIKFPVVTKMELFWRSRHLATLLFMCLSMGFPEAWPALGCLDFLADLAKCLSPLLW